MLLINPRLPSSSSETILHRPSSNMPAAGATTTHESTIANCLAEAQSGAPDAQLAALHILSSLTKVSPANRDLLANTPAAISTILSLSCSTPALRPLALSILFNLSLNPHLKRSLATPTTILHLNSLLLSPSFSKLSASLINSLSMPHKNKAAFGVAGTVEAIVQALASRDQLAPAANHLLSSLLELVQFHGNCTLAVRAGAVLVLARVLAGPEALMGPTLAILSLLARFEEGIAALRGVGRVVGLVMDGLRRGCATSRESAAEILVRLFEVSEECMREAAGSYDFSSLLADLSIRGSAKARENAGELMKMMMEANLDCYVEGNPIVLDC